MKINHIGIIVDDIERSVNIYKSLGYTLEKDIIVDEIQNNIIVFMKSKDSSLTLELVQPLNNNSTVKNFKGYHHICFEVDDLNVAMKSFYDKKIGIIFTKKIKAPAFDNRNVIFAYLKNGNIIEILEKGDMGGD